MSRLVKVSLNILLVCLISMARAGQVKAVPPLPSSFYGTVQVNGQDTPDGTLVRALIDGQMFASGATQTFEGKSVYFLDIPGDDTGTDLKDGGLDQETIQFEVGGALADQEGTWISGTNVALNLTVTMTALVEEKSPNPTRIEQPAASDSESVSIQPGLTTPTQSTTASPSNTEPAYAPPQTNPQAYPAGGSLNPSTPKPAVLAQALPAENIAESSGLSASQKRLAAGAACIFTIFLAWIAVRSVKANRRNSTSIK